MDVKKLANELKNEAGEVENLMRRKLPVIIGRMAKDHYQDNFRKGGFVNRGLQQWPVTRRLCCDYKDTKFESISQHRPVFLSSR